MPDFELPPQDVSPPRNFAPVGETPDFSGESFGSPKGFEPEALRPRYKPKVFKRNKAPSPTYTVQARQRPATYEPPVFSAPVPQAYHDEPINTHTHGDPFQPVGGGINGGKGRTLPAVPKSLSGYQVIL